MVNIGSVERPILVSEKALEPSSDEGREWWGKVADGSIILEDEVLDLLLTMTENENR